MALRIDCDFDFEGARMALELNLSDTTVHNEHTQVGKMVL